jgi:hypothetical protein
MSESESTTDHDVIGLQVEARGAWNEEETVEPKGSLKLVSRDAP